MKFTVMVSFTVEAKSQHDAQDTIQRFLDFVFAAISKKVKSPIMNPRVHDTAGKRRYDERDSV